MAKRGLIPKNKKLKSKAKRPVRLAQTVGPSQTRLRSIFEKFIGKPVVGQRKAPLTASDERDLLDRAARGDKAALRERKRILGF